MHSASEIIATRTQLLQLVLVLATLLAFTELLVTRATGATCFRAVANC